jgi:hypothetical protein
MRKLLRFSKELVATRAKPTTEQYDALLAIKGSSGANGVTVGEISEQLQVKFTLPLVFSTDWKHES